MADFDFENALRWVRSASKKTLSSRREDKELPFIREGQIGAQELMLDTCVYIDQMRDNSPKILDTWIE